MLIDDDEVIKVLLSRVLDNLGCIVKSCSSVKSALENLKTSIPDVIILDLNMPEHDGFTFLKFRKLNSILKNIPVIVLSGTKKGEDISLALELGANQFLEKPFESRIILEKLRYIFFLNGKHSYRFKDGEKPFILAEINAEIIEDSLSSFKIESQVKFLPGKSVQILSSDFLKNNGVPIPCKISKQVVLVEDGFYKTIVSPTGLDIDTKKLVDEWRRGLCI